MYTPVIVKFNGQELFFYAQLTDGKLTPRSIITRIENLGLRTPFLCQKQVCLMTEHKIALGMDLDLVDKHLVIGKLARFQAIELLNEDEEQPGLPIS